MADNIAGHIADSEGGTVERHPLRPFLPPGTRMLMLGSFPPPRDKWAMEFFYPNLQNDMWRIFGLVFFGDKNHFLTQKSGGRSIFSKNMLVDFLMDRGIALYDTAEAVVRQKGNASDRFLEIVEKTDIGAVLSEIPECRTIVTTGELASAALSEITGSPAVKVGGCEEFTIGGRTLRHRRMPSSSRAYPLALEKKAEAYGKMFREEGFL